MNNERREMVETYATHLRHAAEYSEKARNPRAADIAALRGWERGDVLLSEEGRRRIEARIESHQTKWLGRASQAYEAAREVKEDYKAFYGVHPGGQDDPYFLIASVAMRPVGLKHNTPTPKGVDPGFYIQP